MTPTLNAYQSEQLRHVLERIAEDDRTARACGERPLGLAKLAWWPCARVPGLVAVKIRSRVHSLLYPTPRPVPGDPQFQHATPLDRSHVLLCESWGHSRRGWWGRDWQWEGVLMSAPDEMPAGGCCFFDYGDEVYGARQLTIVRNAEL